MNQDRTPEVEAYWQTFCERHGVDPDQRLDVWAFGSGAEQADRLLDLVLHGPKRATTGLLEYYEDDGEPVPDIGTYSVLLDGRGQPAAVIRTTGVEIKPMRDIDEAFAWDEGEGDRSLAYWTEAHRNFFSQHLAAKGRTFSDDMVVVGERFELLWPPSDVDPQTGGFPGS